MKNPFWEKLTPKESVFYCFTPEVMLATFFVEIILAVYVFFRYRLSIFGRLVFFTILALALFQLSEYLVCSTTNPLFWSRVGFVLITFLPVLGLHIVSCVTGKKHFLKGAYVLAIVFILIFIFVPKVITDAVCAGNYIIFQIAQEGSWAYMVYYFGILLLGIWGIIERLLETRRQNVDIRKKELLWWILIGYFSFMVPMGIVYVLAAETRIAITSIMCGFAILLAFILVFKILPLKEKLSRQRLKKNSD